MQTTALPIVDAHQHFWDLGRIRHPWLSDEPAIPFRYGDYRALRRNYLPPDFRRETARHRIEGTVHIEAEVARDAAVAESDWLLELQAREGLPSVCVAQARLDGEDAAEVLAAQAARPLVRGIRHKPAAATSPAEARRGAAGSMDCPNWRRGYAMLERHGLGFDLQTPWWHLEAAAELARDFPRTTVVLNHTGLPADRSAEGIAAWRAALDRLAACPNAALKISGLGRPGQDWTWEANGPVIRDAIAIFGADRSMFASNFPVDSLVGSYDAIVDGFLRAIADRPEVEQRALLSENARRIYRI